MAASGTLASSAGQQPIASVPWWLLLLLQPLLPAVITAIYFPQHISMRQGVLQRTVARLSQPVVALRVVPSCPWCKGVSRETIVCALWNEDSIITHLHKCCLGNFNPRFPNFLGTWLYNHYKVFMQAFCVWYVSSLKVTWSTGRIRKGGDSYLGNAKDWNKCFLLALYIR